MEQSRANWRAPSVINIQPYTTQINAHSTFAEIPAAVQIRSYLLRSGSQRSALRRPLIYRTHQPAFHHSGFQKRPDQLQQPPIADPGFDSGYQFVLRNPVEKFLQIQIYAPAITFRDVLLRLSH